MIYVPFYDNNGNIIRHIDSSGNTVAQYTYDAFGDTISQSDSLAGFEAPLHPSPPPRSHPPGYAEVPRHENRTKRL